MSAASLSSARFARVLYHYPCPDGAFAAAAAALRLRNSSPALDVRFVPHRTGRPLVAQTPSAAAAGGGGGRDGAVVNLAPLALAVADEQSQNVWDPAVVAAALRLPGEGVLPQTSVFLLDYVGPGSAFIKNLCSLVQSVTLIDHHQTAQDIVARMGDTTPANFWSLLDMNHSAAMLALDFFGRPDLDVKPAALSSDIDDDDAMPSLLRQHFDNKEDVRRTQQLYRYIEDHDLFRHALPESRELHAGLVTLNLEYDPDISEQSSDMDLFDRMLALNPSDLIELGRAEIGRQQCLIDAELEEAFVVEIPAATGNGSPLRCFGVVTRHPELRSEMGNQLALRSAAIDGLSDVAAICYDDPEVLGPTEIRVSLRGLGQANTAHISEGFGGGGHRCASSFVIAQDVFNAWRI